MRLLTPTTPKRRVSARAGRHSVPLYGSPSWPKPELGLGGECTCAGAFGSTRLATTGRYIRHRVRDAQGRGLASLCAVLGKGQEEHLCGKVYSFVGLSHSSWPSSPVRRPLQRYIWHWLAAWAPTGAVSDGRAPLGCLSRPDSPPAPSLYLLFRLRRLYPGGECAHSAVASLASLSLSL